MRSTFVLSLCIGLSACAQFPALDGTITDAARDAPYPQLTTLPVFVQTTQASVADAAMAARIEALQAKAERLRATQIAALQ